MKSGLRGLVQSTTTLPARLPAAWRALRVAGHGVASTITSEAAAASSEGGAENVNLRDARLLGAGLAGKAWLSGGCIPQDPSIISGLPRRAFAGCGGCYFVLGARRHWRSLLGTVVHLKSPLDMC